MIEFLNPHIRESCIVNYLPPHLPRIPFHAARITGKFLGRIPAHKIFQRLPGLFRILSMGILSLCDSPQARFENPGTDIPEKKYSKANNKQ